MVTGINCVMGMKMKSGHHTLELNCFDAILIYGKV